jgi:hypothetical protein
VHKWHAQIISKIGGIYFYPAKKTRQAKPHEVLVFERWFFRSQYSLVRKVDTHIWNELSYIEKVDGQPELPKSSQHLASYPTCPVQARLARLLIADATLKGIAAGVGLPKFTPLENGGQSLEVSRSACGLCGALIRAQCSNQPRPRRTSGRVY